MTMSEVNKGGRPREEPTNVRSVRLPNRVWELVLKDRRKINSLENIFKSK